MEKFTKVVLNTLAVLSIVGVMAGCAGREDETALEADTTAILTDTTMVDPMPMDSMAMDTTMADTTMMPGM